MAEPVRVHPKANLILKDSLRRTDEQILFFSEEVTSSANLRVTPSLEPLFTRKLDILEVIEGRTARFDCKVSGSPAPRVTWMHFGKAELGAPLFRFPTCHFDHL